MKKIVLALSFLFAVAANAQTDKGWRSVGGTGNLTLDFKNKSHSFGLAPEMYWFVANNFALGTDFGFGFFAQKPTDSTSFSGTNFYLTPGIRYYFGDTEKKLRPYAFGNGGFEWMANRSKISGQTSNSSSSGFRGYAGMGLGWFFNENACFDTRLHVFDYTRNDIFFNPTFSIGIIAFFD